MPNSLQFWLISLALFFDNILFYFAYYSKFTLILDKFMDELR